MDDRQDIAPAVREAEKTRKEKAADWAYTTNHAILCTITDPITDIYFSNLIQKKLGNKTRLGNISAAEIIGDFGAVPFTIGMQRCFPGLMGGLSKLVEPVFGGAFKVSSRRDAREWAARHGFSADSDECRARADRIYNYEITHLPQALMWTVSSVGINVASQRALGNKAPISHISAAKVGGSVLTAGITLGARMLFPRKVEKIDKFISEELLIPAEDGLGSLVSSSKDQEKGWSQRVRQGDNRESGVPSM